MLSVRRRSTTSTDKIAFVSDTKSRNIIFLRGHNPYSSSIEPAGILLAFAAAEMESAPNSFQVSLTMFALRLVSTKESRMKKGFAIVLGITFLFIFSLLATSAYAQDTQEPAGKTIFLDSKCNMCHSIEAAGIQRKLATSKAPDLSNVGSERTAEWIAKWITRQEELDGKKHQMEFKGKPEDLKTLSEWVASFKKGEQK
jgi:hypothetical protein